MNDSKEVQQQSRAQLTDFRDDIVKFGVLSLLIRDEQVEQGGFLGQQNYSAVCDPIMVDACYHTFVKSLWMHSTKTEL